jgi:hypothetical protein
VLNKQQPIPFEENTMANNKLLQQMLEHLVNDDQAKAEELFHEYVVTASREIYESLIDSEIAEETDEDGEEGEDKKEKKVDEEFEEFTQEGDDEMPKMGGTPDMGDDLEADIDADMDDEDMGDKSEEELFQDLDSIVDELQAKFDELKGGDDMGDMGDDDMGDMGDMGDEKMKDDFDLETVREYVEKVPAGHGAEKKGQSEKADGSAGGMKFSKNDMGGASLKFGMEDTSDKGTAGGLAGNKPKVDNMGNVNVPGAKNGNAFSTKEPGHGAEKAGAKETADKSAAGLFRGRR